MKNLTQDQDPRRMTVALHEERSSVAPFGDPDWHTEFTPDRIAILRSDGTVVAERDDPRASFAGHEKMTPWDPLHRAYFNGYALWTYLTTPFLLTMEGVQVTEMETWTEGREMRAVLQRDSPSRSRPTARFRLRRLRRGPSASTPRLQCRCCGRLGRGLAGVRLHRGGRHPTSEQASRLYPRGGLPAETRSADGLHRHPQGPILLIHQATS